MAKKSKKVVGKEPTTKTKKLKPLINHVPPPKLAKVIQTHIDKYETKFADYNIMWGNNEFLIDDKDLKDPGLVGAKELADGLGISRKEYRMSLVKDLSRGKGKTLANYLKRVDINVWQWIGHCSRLQKRAFDQQPPHRKVVVIPITTIYPLLNVLVGDDLHNLEQAILGNANYYQQALSNLGVCASRLGLRLVPEVDYVPARLSSPGAMMKGLGIWPTSHSSSSNKGMAIHVDDPSELMNKTYIPYVYSEEDLDRCCRNGVRCIMDLNVLKDGNTKASQVRKSTLFKDWVQHSWGGTNPLAFVDEPTDKQISIWSKLVPLIVQR